MTPVPPPPPPVTTPTVDYKRERLLTEHLRRIRVAVTDAQTGLDEVDKLFFPLARSVRLERDDEPGVD